MNLSREFLASNGASKHQVVRVEEQEAYEVPPRGAKARWPTA